ncbi:translation initiation factor IF-2-like [Myotis myotis]|uniref:translation initiation factor IF-2-like n=1 Tax=Myotis myotis TaxID=51298 RepID=UPI0017487A88|nr:translation initiation factor IF-2-like [Myotis myotis]
MRSAPLASWRAARSHGERPRRGARTRVRARSSAPARRPWAQPAAARARPDPVTPAPREPGAPQRGAARGRERRSPTTPASRSPSPSRERRAGGRAAAGGGAEAEPAACTPRPRPAAAAAPGRRAAGRPGRAEDSQAAAGRTQRRAVGRPRPPGPRLLSAAPRAPLAGSSKQTKLSCTMYQNADGYQGGSNGDTRCIYAP